ncbi:MAG: endonuclease/exonuclease/phosphatase family protein [Actinomycetota bacterium]
MRPGPRLALLVGALVALGAAPGGATAPAASPAAALRVVNVNILHGIFCDDGAACQASDRVDLFLGQLEAAGCPEVVGIQEVNDTLRRLFTARLPATCRGAYRTVFADADRNDSELVLTSLRARRPRIVALPGPLRTASRVELTSPAGPVVLVVTHQDGDRDFPACRDDVDRYRCPAPCPVGTTFSECQTIVGLRLAATGGSRRSLRVYMGDFNVPPASPRYQAIVADGFVDSHLAAGNAECDPATGSQCTAGRDDTSIAALKDPTARESERIDFIFVKAPKRCTPRFVPSGSGTGVGTGLFAATPAPSGPGGLVWPSDHTAVSMELTCA